MPLDGGKLNACSMCKITRWQLSHVWTKPCGVVRKATLHAMQRGLQIMVFCSGFWLVQENLHMRMCKWKTCVH